MVSSILEIKELTAGYGKIEVLHGISVQVEFGKAVCLIGPNGAGKTTMLRSILGFTNIMSGDIIFAGERITGMKPHLAIGKGIAYASQEKSVFPSLTVSENLELGAYSQNAEQFKESLEGVYQRFPVLKGRSRQGAGTLSGGERTMLALGRSLMSNPKLLLLDEPSMGLAPKIVDSLFASIREINAAGVTTLLVEQNARRALELADYAYVLDLGEIKFEGAGHVVASNEKVQRLYLGGG